MKHVVAGVRPDRAGIAFARLSADCHDEIEVFAARPGKLFVTPDFTEVFTPNGELAVAENQRWKGEGRIVNREIGDRDFRRSVAFVRDGIIVVAAKRFGHGGFKSEFLHETLRQIADAVAEPGGVMVPKPFGPGHKLVPHHGIAIQERQDFALGGFDSAIDGPALVEDFDRTVRRSGDKWIVLDPANLRTLNYEYISKIGLLLIRDDNFVVFDAAKPGRAGNAPEAVGQPAYPILVGDDDATGWNSGTP